MKGVADKDEFAVEGYDSGAAAGNTSMSIVSKKDDVGWVRRGSVGEKCFVMWKHVIRCSGVGACRDDIVAVGLEDLIGGDLENAVGMGHERGRGDAGGRSRRRTSGETGG